MLWSWFFYLLLLSCLPGIQVQPRCCGPNLNCADCEGTTPEEFQVVIAGLATGPFGLCANCADLNGTYVLTRRKSFDDLWCVWGYCQESPCPALSGDPDQQGIVIQLRIKADGGGGLDIFLEMTTGDTNCTFSGSGAPWVVIGQWSGNRPSDQDCTAIVSKSLTAVDAGALAYDPNCNTYPNYTTQPTAVVTAL